MIKFINVTKNVHDDIILNEFNFRIKKGTFHIFAGVNSFYIADMLYGIDLSYSGDIFIEDHNVKFNYQKLRGNIVNLVGFDVPFLANETVKENFELAYYTVLDNKYKLLESILKFTINTPLYNKLNSRVEELTNLEKYYFFVTRALITYPKVIIFKDFYVRELHDYLNNLINYLISMGITVVYTFSNIHHIYYFEDIKKRVIKV